ncbi:shikimate dehydrogenase [Jiella sp. M17.18]|uniref:shikimate dehydrogenase family protein n=1 Tax=Jiella sp. M17.18 TaxID=3234247 RepID=UPI0034DE05E7
MPIAGATRIVPMIGSPIAQVRSPILFNRIFSGDGADARAVVPLEVQPNHLDAFFALLRGAGNCDGVILTIPHKEPAFELVDSMSERARALEAVNVVRREPDGRLVGDMVDGVGFWAAADEAGFCPAGKTLVLAGAGAAGTAIALAFAQGGGRAVRILDSEPRRIDRLAEKLAGSGCAVEALSDARWAEVEAVVNATPVGMAYRPGSLFSDDQLACLPADGMVGDAITEPAETALLRAARARGLAAVDGHAMAAGQFRAMYAFLYPGEAAPALAGEAVG